MNSPQLYNLIQKYGKIMYLKVFVDSNDEQLKQKYLTAMLTHNEKLNNDFIDAGFDLFCPVDLSFYICNVNKLDHNVICSAQMFQHNMSSYNTGYYMYARSSVSKIGLRLANSGGILDAGYRGHLIGMFDLLYSDTGNKHIDQYDRFAQICSPGLVPIYVEIVDSKEDLGENTSRGEGGFGSTGV